MLQPIPQALMHAHLAAHHPVSQHKPLLCLADAAAGTSCSHSAATCGTAAAGGATRRGGAAGCPVVRTEDVHCGAGLTLCRKHHLCSVTRSGGQHRQRQLSHQLSKQTTPNCQGLFANPGSRCFLNALPLPAHTAAQQGLTSGPESRKQQPQMPVSPLPALLRLPLLPLRLGGLRGPTTQDRNKAGGGSGAGGVGGCCPCCAAAARRCSRVAEYADTLCCHATVSVATTGAGWPPHAALPPLARRQAA